MTALSDELPSDELIAAERPAFEAWCKSEGIDAELWIKGQPQCGYTNARTTDYWTGWIARARALLAAQPAVQQPAEDAELLAETPTPKPQVGLWTLIAPNGRMYQADSPLRCCGLEQRERVPADVAMARILRAASEPDDSELLDWLDATNKRFKMGWKVGVAPAGNCSVQSIICLGNSEPATIREAIRAAIKAQGGKQ